MGLKHHNQLYLFSGDGRRQFRRFEHVKSIPPQLVIFSLWDQSQFYSDRPSDYGAAVTMAGAAATLGVAGSYYSYGVSYFFKKDDIWYKAIGPAAEAMGIMGICLHLVFGR